MNQPTIFKCVECFGQVTKVVIDYQLTDKRMDEFKIPTYTLTANRRAWVCQNDLCGQEYGDGDIPVMEIPD